MVKNVGVLKFGWKGKMVLFVMLFALLTNGVDGKKISQEKLSEVNKKLKMLVKPATKSIKSEDGDIIDCVDIYKQPAFDHPALKNHTIQMQASHIPTIKESSTNTNGSATITISQLWHKSGSCPKGTVPIRRIQKRDLLRTTSLESFGRKNPYIGVTIANTTDGGTNYFPQANRSITHLLTEGYSYIGAMGDINVWNPYVESDDYSSAQIFLRNGPPDHYESVESGWVVNPGLYGDTKTRLFAYWTSDSSATTGCFDLTCSGFIQTNHEIALGASINPISSIRGNQFQISIFMYLDPNTNNWWLQYGNKVTLGYWPGSLFPLLSHNALYVMWGGEVYSTKTRVTPHTKTAMGSGEYAESLFGAACFIRNIRIIDYSLNVKFPEWVVPMAQEPYCYHADFHAPYTREPEFYFGGPGQNHLCP